MNRFYYASRFAGVNKHWMGKNPLLTNIAISLEESLVDAELFDEREEEIDFKALYIRLGELMQPYLELHNIPTKEDKHKTKYIKGDWV